MMIRFSFAIGFIFLFTLAPICAQIEQRSYRDYNWSHVATRMPDEWYGSDEAIMVADSVLKYQTEIGGWPKNSGFHREVNHEEMARIKSSGIGATFDNGATLTEMKFLSKMYGRVKDERYQQAFIRAIDYIFKAQYAHGGWPQFFPYRGGRSAYSSHITYNDNAMISVMQFLKEIIERNEVFKSMNVSEELRLKAKESFDRGIDCILKTQIIVNDNHTVWCAQHDEFTFKPAMARSYELASFSGSESVGIVELLMSLENPSVEIVRAVEGAVKWFQDNKIENTVYERFIGEDGERDGKITIVAGAPPIWARFYDLETSKPYFADRDGVKKESMAEIGKERRGGYSWYTRHPQRVLDAYPEWKRKIGK